MEETRGTTGSLSQLCNLASGLVIDIEGEMYKMRYWRQEILATEQAILIQLEWRVLYETPISHLENLLLQETKLSHPSDLLGGFCLGSRKLEFQTETKQSIFLNSQSFAGLGLKHLTIYQDFDPYTIALACVACARAKLHVSPIWPGWIPRKGDCISLHRLFPCFVRLQQCFMMHPIY